MDIVKTAALLIITLLVVPLFSYFFGVPLDALSRKALELLLQVMAVAIASSFVVG